MNFQDYSPIKLQSKMELNKKIDHPQPSQTRIKNNKILDQLLQLNSGSYFQKITPDYLSSFIYHDHISKNVMNVSKESAFGSSLGRSRSILRLSHPDSSGIMKESFDLLKSTRKFHINSIQNKNYKMTKLNEKANEKAQEKQNSNEFRIIEKKLIEKYLKNKQETEQKYRQQKKSLSKMLELSKISSKDTPKQDQIKDRLSVPLFANPRGSHNKKQEEKISEGKNKSKIISNCEGKKSPKHIKYQQYFGTKGKENSYANIYDETQKQVLKDADHQFKYLIRKNAEFLVTPDINKRLIVKNKNKQEKSSQASNTPTSKQIHQPNNKIKDQSYYSKQEIMQYCFKSNQELPLSREPLPCEKEAKNNEKYKLQQKIIRQIQLGNYFRVEIELSVNPLLLLVKDRKNNNNLLHICVMNNREDIFEMIAKKCKIHQIDLIYEKNKYGRNPIQLGKILSFFKKKQINQLLASFQKEKIKRTYELLHKIIPK